MAAVFMFSIFAQQQCARARLHGHWGDAGDDLGWCTLACPIGVHTWHTPLCGRFTVPTLPFGRHSAQVGSLGTNHQGAGLHKTTLRTNAKHTQHRESIGAFLGGQRLRLLTQRPPCRQTSTAPTKTQLPNPCGPGRSAARDGVC